VTRAVTPFALAVLALLGASGGGAATAQATKLVGTVGPEFTISLVDSQGNRVTKLDPGPYEIEVRDRSDFHNFHLQGPGVDVATDTTFTGDTTWQVTLRDGAYRFLCDVHPDSMRGAFTAGTPPAAPPTQPSPGGAITAKTKLVLTSGPRQAITLRTSAGKAVTSLAEGTYTVTVRDRGTIHNAHVTAPGYNRRTTPIGYTGTQTWKVKLARSGLLRFFCDPHRLAGMQGSARIVS
jgi:plastocyanin